MRVTIRLLWLALAATLCWFTPLAATAQSPEETLVTYYYQSILGRAPDPAGLTFWTSEVSRLRNLGQEPQEVFIAMSNQFFASTEYQSRKRNNSQIVNDLYLTFLQRAPDPAGLEYWTGLLAQGVPLNVLLAGFQFSPEFHQFIEDHLGIVGARAEGSLVLDFYRGYLNRLPEPGGLEYWIGQFQAAQCAMFADLSNQADNIAQGFQSSAEYVGRDRSNMQFVGDLYSAFMRRAAESAGLTYWSQQLSNGASRADVRQFFLTSPEFSGRLAVAFLEGCYQPSSVAAAVSSITPNNNVASGTRITITGTSFRQDTRVTIGGRLALMEYISPQAMVVTVPFGGGGTLSFMSAGPAPVLVDGQDAGSVGVIVPPVIGGPPGQVTQAAISELLNSVRTSDAVLIAQGPYFQSLFPTGQAAVDAVASQLPAMVAKLEPDILAIFDRALSNEPIASGEKAAATSTTEGDAWLDNRAQTIQLQNGINNLLSVVGAVFQGAAIGTLQFEAVLPIEAAVKFISAQTKFAVDNFSLNSLQMAWQPTQASTSAAGGIIDLYVNLWSVTGAGTLSASITTTSKLDVGRWAADMASLFGAEEALIDIVNKAIADPAKALLATQSLKAAIAKAKEILGDAVVISTGNVVTNFISLDRLVPTCPRATLSFPAVADVTISVGSLPAIALMTPSTERCKIMLSQRFLTNEELHARPVGGFGTLPDGKNGIFLNLSVVRRAVSVTVASSASSPKIGDKVTFTAKVTEVPDAQFGAANILPTPYVTFSDLAAPICVAQPLTGGVANCSWSFFDGGPHTIVAQYAGDANFLPGDGSAALQVQYPAGKVDFLVSPTDLFTQLQYSFDYNIAFYFGLPGPYDCEWSGFGWGAEPLIYPNCTYSPYGYPGLAGTYSVTLNVKQHASGTSVGQVTKSIPVYPGPGLGPGFNYTCVDTPYMTDLGYANHHYTVDISGTAYMQLGGKAGPSGSSTITSCGSWRTASENGKNVCYRDTGMPVNSSISFHDDQSFYSGQLFSYIFIGGFVSGAYGGDGPDRTCSIVQ